MIVMSMNKFWSSKKGTSLVEILVVMVVLLVGIMTIIQMFPTGFRVVRAGESRTIATKFSGREIERWKNMASNVPEGILPIDDDGNVLNGQYPGPPFEIFRHDADGSYITDANGHYVRGNVLNIRQVVGEKTSIPVRTDVHTGVGVFDGCPYNLAYGPVEVNGFSVKGGDLARKVVASGVFPTDVVDGEYAIDYGVAGLPEFHLVFPADYSGHERLYYVSYSYWVDDGGLSLVTKLNQPVVVPAGYTAGWVPVPVTPPYGTFVEVQMYTDTCARGFKDVTGIGFGDDYYEFILADDILGTVVFNPAARGQYEYTKLGRVPLEARLDYRIYDPRIIREDKVAPQPVGSLISVKLALRFILDAGSPTDLNDGSPTDNPDEPTFEGLMKGKIGDPEAAPLVRQSVLIMDLATGYRVDMTDVEVDYIPGTVVLPEFADLLDPASNPVENVALEGRRLAFFYRADGDWVIQCQKAYSVYTHLWDANALDYRHCRLVQAAEGGESKNRLLFAPSEAGKTVLVDYTYNEIGQETLYKITGESRRISDALDSNGNAYTDLELPADAYVIESVYVVGTSFKARTIWRDGTNWRHTDVDTNLSRVSSGI